MESRVSFGRAFEEGLQNLKVNFWPCILVIIILAIVESFSNGAFIGNGKIWNPASAGMLAFLVSTFIKPIFDYGAKLTFVRVNRGESMDAGCLVEGFRSRHLYIDIILTNAILIMIILLGFIALILPGIYILCRTVLAPYLVINKGLGPKQAVSASWELMRDFWPQVIVMGIISSFLFLVGLVAFIVGIFPAFAWIKAMFASFYQQVIDVHDEEFLDSMGIEP